MLHINIFPTFKYTMQESKTLQISELDPIEFDSSDDEEKIQKSLAPPQRQKRGERVLPKSFRESKIFDVPKYRQEKVERKQPDFKGHVKTDIKKVPREIDVRTPGAVSYKEDLYDSLVNLVLNHRVELKKMPSLMSVEDAQKFAEKSNGQYRYKSVDLNEDGEPDIVLYNKAGQPVIINGYKAKASDFGYQNLFRKTHDTAKKRAEIGGYSEFINSKFGYKPGVHAWEAGTLTTENPVELEKIAQRGYRKILRYSGDYVS